MAAPAAEPSTASPVVFFDGECPFCNRSVSYLARQDRAGRLRFAHLQGPFAQTTLPAELRDAGRDGTVVLLEPAEGGRVSVRSAAVLRALAYLGRPPREQRRLLRLAESPRALRVLDVLYRAFVRRRDRWFGRSPVCLAPDPAWRARFLG
jgi:predicted DCC family thiol-disulfide oxidoreductase YuxK